MEKDLSIIVITFCMAVSLVCAGMLWLGRKEVHDRSRLFLSICTFAVGGFCAIYLAHSLISTHDLSHALLEPYLVIVGVYVITLYVFYPIEVMRPRELKGKWVAILLLPALFVTLPLLFGIRFRDLQSLADLAEHWTDFDVLYRLVCVLLVVVTAFLLFVIPYNWRASSADRKWLWRAIIIAQGMAVFFCLRLFLDKSVFTFLHVLWTILGLLYFTHYELVVRILPPRLSRPMPPRPTAVSQAVNAGAAIGDYWPQICQVVDEWEIWRNPDATVEMVSATIGIGRNQVVRCIREHTGLSFPDFMNKKRVDFMSDQLRRDPRQDHKQLYFEAGFRSRQKAYHNFIRFRGSSPTEFITSWIKSK